jgi:hypothetical protein
MKKRDKIIQIKKRQRNKMKENWASTVKINLYRIWKATADEIVNH